jgi:hypothetical protein
MRSKTNFFFYKTYECPFRETNPLTLLKGTTTNPTWMWGTQTWGQTLEILDSRQENPPHEHYQRFASCIPQDEKNPLEEPPLSFKVNFDNNFQRKPKEPTSPRETQFFRSEFCQYHRNEKTLVYEKP